MIERAATDLDHSRKIIPGGNFSFLIEQSVVGELSDEVWDALVAAVRGFPGSAGKSKQTHEWIGGSDTARIMLNGTSRQGRVQLKLLGDVSGISALTIVFGLIAGIFATLAPIIVAVKQSSPPSHWVTFLLSILAACLCVAGTTGILQVLRSRLRSRLNGLMDRLVEVSASGQAEINTGAFLSKNLQLLPSSIESESLRQETTGG